MADTIKCPNCGSNLTLNADTQKLECPSCGASFDPASLNTITVDELEAKQAEPTDPSQEAAQAYAAQQAAEAQQAAQAQQEAAPEQTEFVCNACGAKIVTDSHTAATFCAFCGSPALVGKRLTEQF